MIIRWDDLQKYTNVGKSILLRWTKLAGFPAPQYQAIDGRIVSTWSKQAVDEWITNNPAYVATYRRNLR